MVFVCVRVVQDASVCSPPPALLAVSMDGSRLQHVMSIKSLTGLTAIFHPP